MMQKMINLYRDFKQEMLTKFLHNKVMASDIIFDSILIKIKNIYIYKYIILYLLNKILSIVL
jgi:hypothetical protein